MNLDIVRATIAEYGSSDALAEYVLAHQQNRVYKMFDIYGDSKVVSGEAEAVLRLKSHEPEDGVWVGFSIEAGEPMTIMEIVRREDVVDATDDSIYTVIGPRGEMHICLTLTEAREYVRRAHKKCDDDNYTIIDEHGWCYLLY